MMTTGDEVRELLETRWEQLGYDRLLPSEKDFVLVWWLEAEASNGTLHQYFYNSTGDAALEALAALERLGADRKRSVLLKAVEAFGPESYPTDRADRIVRMDLIPDHYALFRRLTDDLFAPSADGAGVASLAIDQVGLAYNELGIDAADYAPKSPFRLSAVLLLIFIAGAVILGLIMSSVGGLQHLTATEH